MFLDKLFINQLKGNYYLPSIRYTKIKTTFNETTNFKTNTVDTDTDYFKYFIKTNNLISTKM